MERPASKEQKKWGKRVHSIQLSEPLISTQMEYSWFQAHVLNSSRYEAIRRILVLTSGFI